MENRFSGMTDEELVASAQEGNLEAEEFLIRKYKELVRSRSQFYFIIGADSDDVVQEGMIGLFKAIQSYSAGKEASFKTFAELCVNRQIITAIKTASRRKHGPLNDSVSLNDPVNEEEQGTTLGEMLHAGKDMQPEEELLMKDLMDSISSNEQNLFSAFEMQVWNEYLRGRDYREIAQILDKSPKAVDNAIQRTKKKIMASICR
ncbi:MAG: RNA polymerase sporulation sigma factor SigH [Firmicutes bacterium]|nr:RNA polymerase sporulation sigma factor SigH [Bacillota bacterium]